MAFSYRQLSYALALGRTRHFGRAAAALGISQPALTRSIRALETQLGVTLFDRLPSGVEPTVFGEIFLRRGAPLEADANDLVRELELLQGLAVGEVTITCAAYPRELVAPHAIGRVLGKYPGLRIRLRGGNWRDAADHVAMRESDLGIADLRSVDEALGIVGEAVGQHPLYFYARADHPLTTRPELTVSDLHQYPWVGTRTVARVGQHLSAQGVASGHLDPENGDFLPAVQVDDITTCRLMVETSDIISAAPLSMIATELAAGTLVALPFAAPWLHLDYGFITLEGRSLPPAALAFMEAFRERDAEFAVYEAELKARFLSNL
jgi:DNA-binding transcriptional LysR family regulator